MKYRIPSNFSSVSVGGREYVATRTDAGHSVIDVGNLDSVWVQQLKDYYQAEDYSEEKAAERDAENRKANDEKKELIEKLRNKGVSVDGRMSLEALRVRLFDVEAQEALSAKLKSGEAAASLPPAM